MKAKEVVSRGFICPRCENAGREFFINIPISTTNIGECMCSTWVFVEGHGWLSSDDKDNIFSERCRI